MIDGIIGITPEGRTAISYAGKTFYTADKSVIAMAARGNVAGAAKRWIGKSSAARALRQTNNAAIKPLTKDVAGTLFRKTFKESKKSIGTSAQERKQFVEEYKKTNEEVAGYIEDKIIDKISLSDTLDKLPNDLQQRIKNTVQSEVEKAYAAKGSVDDSDIERIYDKVTIEMNDYLLVNSHSVDSGTVAEIQDYIGAREYLDFSELEDY